MLKFEGYKHKECCFAMENQNILSYGGVPFKYLGFLFFRGNMSAGGINFPVAEQQHMAVTSCPLSADEIEPTCFFPLKEITFGGRFADV
ncbi:unnamed protein product [Acanthoscelides obtectus]|uniref:Uncharacterized protein n=1 Tax=Acanthoscelides obtectus TaxID=200917 RepID=A0A9P0L8B6_ACAOB|nr:unnamed protein product [Acanthoscelides obtectus]CAK1640659.1 hypothetical protein AOBTE_LOCUS11850 [Acanthoscelides obtectus]